jgi:hypothetical protein
MPCHAHPSEHGSIQPQDPANAARLKRAEQDRARAARALKRARFVEGKVLRAAAQASCVKQKSQATLTVASELVDAVTDEPCPICPWGCTVQTCTMNEIGMKRTFYVLR